ncbi:MAG: 2-phospho-L-lactate transferase [Nitrososphaerota archaeon]|nr:2-phospho-L-lactate transferase [Candidatus Bathyarchaeota archaeon]MDW8048416.1 2-phospho-L-lactate transferase [Nitrososphaerota archaeon]
MLTALAGGVGAAKFLRGLVEVVPNEDITIIVNTGDDIEFHGLHISPDIDIITYTLAGLVDECKGWGINGDTFHCLEMLKTYGHEGWFKLGDRDLATHIHRTDMLRRGFKLSEVTADISKRLGIRVKIIPMTDDRFETWVLTDAGLMHFQEFLVKRGSADRVLDVKFFGEETAQPAPGVIEAIEESEIIIVCPSNPIVSIGTILSLKGVRGALKKSEGCKVAISPIVGGRPIKGPADKLMSGIGLEVSAYSVAKLYADFLNIFVLDKVDEKERTRIEDLGVSVVVTNTIMRTHEDRVLLAGTVLNEAKKFSKK